MLFRSHIAFGFLIGLLFVKYFRPSNPILFIILVLLFSIVPDIDEKRSKISKKFTISSFFLRLFFEHRGFLHSAFIPMVLFIIFYYFNLKLVGLAILVGYLTHLVLDITTVAGLQLFYPFKKKFRGFIRVGSLAETLFFWIVLVLDVWLLFNL